MAKRKEIKFRDRYGILAGRQNGIRFLIRKDPGLPDTCVPAYWVTIYPGQGKHCVNTGRHRNFHLEEAKEFCQKVAAGEIKVEDLQAEFEAEDAAEKQAAIQ